MALAIYPKVFTVALLIAFLCAFSNSNSSKQILIHSRAETYSGPLSAILPTRSIQFSCTYFLKKVRKPFIKSACRKIFNYVKYLPFHADFSISVLDVAEGP